MDLVNITNDGLFDTGPQPVTTVATWQKLGRLVLDGDDVLASVIVGTQTIGSFKVTQSAYRDDPNQVDLAAGTGFNSPSLAGESYVIPAVVLPLAAGSVLQFHAQSSAVELTFWAQGAGGSNGTVQVKGTRFRRAKRA